MTLSRSLTLALACLFALTGFTLADEAPRAAPMPCGRPVDDFFADEVWAKLGSQKCLTCHRAAGEAAETDFVLLDPKRVGYESALKHNRDAFERVARWKEGEQYTVLRKALGELDHGGKEVLKADSSTFKLLTQFVARVNAPAEALQAADDPQARPFLEGVVMLDDRRLLRRLTLQLAARLPTEAELTVVEQQGTAAIPALLDAVMKEEAFYERLREGFDDIFLTTGLEDNPEAAVLSYEHFEKSRLWYQHYDLSAAGDAKERERARWRLADVYRDAINGEPMRLIDHIVRNDRPFTEIVTADYILVSPYSARGYGIFEQIKEQFENPDDPFEYIPVKLPALKGRNRNQDQHSPTGFYPHSGMLTMFQYLKRYPTTETNRNRLRVRMYFQHFLGVDVLELAARVGDAAAVTAKFEIPTMQAAECVVCHQTIDPVAGLYQEYYDLNGVFGRRKEGWYRDMFGPGFEGEALPESEVWRSLQWLGERTAKDPRFATAMVEHVYYIMTGRKVVQPPKDVDDPLFKAKTRAYREQRREIEAVAAKFVAGGFNLKTAFKELALSAFYRADGLSSSDMTPEREAELSELGIVRMLAPEQLERKIKAVFGEPWGRLKDEMAMLYGGIDSKEVTERAQDPSGAMGAIQRTMANDVACRRTIAEFMKPSSERLLFAGVDPGVVPGASAEGDDAIRKVIVQLHERVLGRHDAPDSAEVQRTFELFAGIVADASQRKGLENREIYHCRREMQGVPDDPHYTIRAWRGVLTYLLRRPEFLYE